MVLNNYWIWKAYIDSNYIIESGTIDNPTLGMKDPSGHLAKMCVQTAAINWPSIISNWAIRTNLSIVLGTGDATPTAGDVKLFNDVTSLFSFTNTTINTSNEGNREKTIITTSGTNLSSSTVTIREVGILKNTIALNETGSPVLLVREVLDTPKDISVGSGFLLTFAWEEA